MIYTWIGGLSFGLSARLDGFMSRPPEATGSLSTLHARGELRSRTPGETFRLGLCAASSGKRA